MTTLSRRGRLIYGSLCRVASYGLFFMLLATLGLLARDTYRRERGERVEAEITQMSLEREQIRAAERGRAAGPERRRISRSRNRRPIVHVRFDAVDGRRYDAFTPVSQSVFERVRVGDKLPMVYLAFAPSFTAVYLQNDGEWASQRSFYWGMVFFFGIPALVLYLFSRRLFGGEYQALRREMEEETRLRSASG